MSSWYSATVDIYLICKQLFLDIAGMLEGNLTALVYASIELVSAQAGVFYDVEALLEKVITMLTS